MALPIANALIAIVFYGLYGAWLRKEAQGPQALGAAAGIGPTAEQAEQKRRQRVRMIFALQGVLSLIFSVIAHAMVGLRVESPADRPLLITISAASLVVGGVGCALALSSEISSRGLGLLARRLR